MVNIVQVLPSGHRSSDFSGWCSKSPSASVGGKAEVNAAVSRSCDDDAPDTIEIKEVFEAIKRTAPSAMAK
jgi:hypothetical protein